MHLLGFCSLACSLLAAALLPGPRRAPAAATAFESGLGFSDTEPDAGEAKVGARCGDPGGLGDRGDPGEAGASGLKGPRTCAKNGLVFHLVCVGSKVAELSVEFLRESFLLFFHRKLLLNRKAIYAECKARKVAGDRAPITYRLESGPRRGAELCWNPG